MNELVPFKAFLEKFIFSLKNERYGTFQKKKTHAFEFFIKIKQYNFKIFTLKSFKATIYCLFISMILSCATKQYTDVKTEKYASALNSTINASNVTVTPQRRRQ